MILTLVVVLLIAVFLFVRKQYTHWDAAGIPNVKAKIPFGNLESVARNERSFGTAIYDIYRQTKEPFLGIYLFFRPAILVRDSELVKNILSRDFQHFHDRGVYCDQKNDPLSASMFALPVQEWKSLRTRLTPAFTSGKLKEMFPIIQNVGHELVKVIKALAEERESVDIKDLSGRYVIDCLASVAFGQEGISTLKNPNHEFRTTGRKINSSGSYVDVIRRASAFVCPGLLKILRLKGLPAYMRNFCLNLVTKTIEEREGNNIVRKDLMQYLIQLRNNNADKADGDEWKINTSEKSVKSMSYEEIAAQVFVFYIAGSESSSATVAYTLYELTQNEELINRAQEDIKLTLANHNGKLSYESINDMKFIDLCVKETLRKYPGLPILNRECTKDYKIPGSKYTIEKGTAIIISLLGIHRDAQFFPEPEKYDPDRFTDEKRAYNEDMYLPFGSGPRNCIAFRMGLLVAKNAIVNLLMNFKLEALSKKELEFDVGTVQLLPKPGQCKIRILKKKSTFTGKKQTIEEFAELNSQKRDSTNLY